MQLRRDQMLPVSGQPAPSPLPRDLSQSLFGTGASCYVLLDGARVPALPAMLDHAGAEAHSLFRGDRLKDFADAGPWLAQVHPDRALAGMLFTASPAPQHLCGKVNIVILLSHAEPAALIAHFRRYVRLRRPDGSLPLFRFWDGLVLADYFDGCSATPQRAARFFGAQGAEPLISTFLLAGQDLAGLVPFYLTEAPSRSRLRPPTPR